MSDLGKQLIETVRAKAAEQPDFVYRAPMVKSPLSGEEHQGGCMYVHADGQPGCIVGHALFAAGLIDASLHENEANKKTINLLAHRLDLPVDHNELTWLSQAQKGQDAGHSWGKSVVGADSYAPLG